MSARGTCPECGYSFPLLKGGTVPTHVLYIGATERRYCNGSGHPAPAPKAKGSE